MKPAQLHAVWSAPDNTRLTAKQFSFRLPTHVAARLAALEEIYPSKTRTQIVADLLNAALDEVETSFPSEPGEAVDRDGDGSWLYEELGPGKRFRELANKHFLDIERELGNENPSPLFPGQLLCSDKEPRA